MHKNDIFLSLWSDMHLSLVRFPSDDHCVTKWELKKEQNHKIGLCKTSASVLANYEKCRSATKHSASESRDSGAEDTGVVRGNVQASERLCGWMIYFLSQVSNLYLWEALWLNFSSQSKFSDRPTAVGEYLGGNGPPVFTLNDQVPLIKSLKTRLFLLVCSDASVSWFWTPV